MAVQPLIGGLVRLMHKIQNIDLTLDLETWTQLHISSNKSDVTAKHNILQVTLIFEQIPEYVILFHTWDVGEVTFEDLSKPDVASMAGYSKIVGCCNLAVRDGYEWAWIDTCCIDKRSSAELSDAINSMYRWYWQAAICYAYLSDVSTNYNAWKQELEASRWFTRGWTLQELLAPAVVEFYNKQSCQQPKQTKISALILFVCRFLGDAVCLFDLTRL